MSRKFTLALVLILLVVGGPRHVGWASPQVILEVVASSWKYVSGTYTDYVNVQAEIKNTSGQFAKDVAVRSVLLRLSGSEITGSTEDPMKVTLAPGESTFYYDSIYTDDAILTSSVQITAFGEPGTEADYLYLPDPKPAYLSSYVSGGWVTYFGEFVNSSGQTWRAECKYCTAPRLIGVYYDGAKVVEWEGSGFPEGHRAPGEKQAFRFQFQRVPGGTFKLFQSSLPMSQGEYPTSWSVEGLQWSLADDWLGKIVQIKATVRNLTDVSAEPDIWLVARDGNGKWLGWTNCWAYGALAPNATIACDDYISSANMHMGKPEDVREVEVLVGSSDITHSEPSTDTPTPTLTATASATPTMTVTPTITSTPSATPTETSTPTTTFTPSATPVRDKRLYLPLLTR